MAKVVVVLLLLRNVSNYSHLKPKNYLRSYTDVKYFVSGQSELAPTRTPCRMGREGKALITVISYGIVKTKCPSSSR